MRMLFVCAVLAMATSISLVRTAAAADADPVVGSWKLDASRSTFKAGPAIKSQTRTYSQSGDQITLEMKTVGADGKETTTHTTYQLNGKSFPVTGTPDYDHLSAKQISANKAEFTLRKGDKVVGTSTRTVSKDGKTLTTTSKMTSAGGERSENRLVFEKQ